MKGVVKWSSILKGDGCIRAAGRDPDEAVRGRDYHFRLEDTEGGMPEKGQRVEFTPRVEEDGRLSASYVVALFGTPSVQKEKKRTEPSKYVRKPTCLKCSGVGDAVAVRGDLVGFRCLTCGHHWTARKGKGL